MRILMIFEIRYAQEATKRRRGFRAEVGWRPHHNPQGFRFGFAGQRVIKSHHWALSPACGPVQRLDGSPRNRTRRIWGSGLGQVSEALQRQRSTLPLARLSHKTLPPGLAAVVALSERAGLHATGPPNRCSAPRLRPLLPNRFGEPLTRWGVAWQLRRLVEHASKTCPSLRGRDISPHTLRHSTAMSLLQSGVAPEVIALWLGHESPNTTHLYVEADLEMKKRALDKMQAPSRRPRQFQPSDKLIRFLESL